MPHALSFFHIFLRGEFLKRKIIKKATLVKRNSWQVQFYFNKILINLIFKINFKKKTSLKVSTNNLTFIRKTLKKNNKFFNYIQNFKTRKKKMIPNPMSEFYKDFFENLNNSNYFKSNKALTFDIMKKNYFFLK